MKMQLIKLCRFQLNWCLEIYRIKTYQKIRKISKSVKYLSWEATNNSKLNCNQSQKKGNNKELESMNIF